MAEDTVGTPETEDLDSTRPSSSSGPETGVGERWTAETEALAASAIARLTRPDLHGQLCPCWTQKADVQRCDCWILPGARDKAAVALTALADAGLRADDRSWADTILEQRDAAITERDRLQAELDEINPQRDSEEALRGAAEAELRAADSEYYALRAELDAARPVVEAAKAIGSKWLNEHPSPVLRALGAAVDALPPRTEDEKVDHG